MIESYQIVSGTSTQILEHYEWKVDYINSIWTDYLIKELNKYKIQIKIENIFKIQPQRANDTNIMENKLLSNIKSVLTTKKFNLYRLYIEINFLSELYNANGMEMKPNLQDYDALATSQSQLRWPNQPKPTNKYWKV